MKKTSLIIGLTRLVMAACPAAGVAGEMDFTLDDNRLVKYAGSGGEVAVPGEIDGSAVYGVGEELFNGNDAVVSLTIAEPVTCIDAYALSVMPSLTSITLPDTLISIEEGNFYYCDELREVTLPASLKSIAGDTFHGCGKLESVTFTGPPPRIGHGSFTDLPDSFVCYVAADQVDAFAEVMPEGITIESNGLVSDIPEWNTASEEDFVFADGVITEYLGSDAVVIIPDQIGGEDVVEIGERAFRWNTNLLEVVIPDGVTVIGPEAFHSAEHLALVECPDSVTEIGKQAFSYGYTGETFDWPEELVTIGEDAFGNTMLYDTLTLPDKVETIGKNAFCWDFIYHLHLPSTMKEIGEDAFQDVLKTVTLPADCSDEVLEFVTARIGEMAPEAQVAREEGFSVTPEDLERFGGHWYLNTVTMDGITVSAADLDMPLTLQMNEDGIAFVNLPEEEEGTWSIEGDNLIIVIPDEEDSVFLERDGQLFMSDMGVSLVFGREAAQPDYVPGQPAEGVTEADLNGTWECFRVSRSGMSIPIELAADSLEELVGFSSIGLEIRGTNVRATGTEEILNFELENGVLKNETFPLSALTLLDDGVLAAELSGGAMYYRKTSDESTLPEIEEETETVTEAATEIQTEPVPEAAAEILTDTAYTCTKAMAGGHVFDPSRLGGTYSVTFRADGTASLTLSGALLEDANWAQEGDAVVVNLYETDRLLFTQEGDGLRLELAGGQELYFEK